MSNVTVPHEEETTEVEVPEWASLSPDEEVIWMGKPVIYPYILESKPSVIPIGVGTLFVFLGLLAMSAGGEALLVGGVLVAMGGFFIFTGVSAIVRNVFEWWSRTYLITSEDVYKKRGILSLAVRNVSVDDIQKTDFRQSWLGRLLSYGTVRIGTAATAGTEIVLQNVRDPQEKAELINELDTS